MLSCGRTIQNNEVDLIKYNKCIENIIIDSARVLNNYNVNINCHGAQRVFFF